ncbi:MAG: PadR family transcriptional regulator [Clostridia bacterium]|nr:PadR family transcriptional regulator [Clostridia bacterium]
MKTADLIPFILLELNEGSKYGFEITKSIETKSNNQIVIKQPTLYTVLKKLEKSKFISSYWEDSDIGGKRHYYQITDNGRMQVSTLPSFDVLLAQALANEEENEDESLTPEQPKVESTEKVVEEVKQEPGKEESKEEDFSIMDYLDVEEEKPTESTTAEPLQNVLPKEEVFENTSVDAETETETNKNNANLLKEESDKDLTDFASNEQVSTFTKFASVTPAVDYTAQIKDMEKSKTKFTAPTPVDYTFDNVKHVDYVNYKSTREYKYSTKATKHLLYKVLATSGYLLLTLIISALVTATTGRSPLYYAFLIFGAICVVFYPTIFAFKYHDIKKRLETHILVPRYKQQLISSGIVLGLVVILCVIVSLVIFKLSFGEMLAISNFANLYAEILITSTLFVDMLFSTLFIRNLSK